MKLLDRYLLTGIIGGTLLVLAVLLALSSFIGFISQIDDVGQGEYTTADAAIYVLLTLPLMAYQMAPFATLLGALVALGNLAARSELIVMRAAGVSPWRLARSVVIAGLVIAVLVAALGEFIAPPAEQYAKRYRTLAMHNELSMGQGQSGWIRDGNIVINIEQLFDEDRAGGIYIFTLDQQRQLHSVVRAASANFLGSGEWVLDDAQRTTFGADRVTAERLDSLTQSTALSPSLLGLSVVDPDSLASAGLIAYIRYLRANDLDADGYLTAFWARIATLVSVVFMALLALPFVFGPLRSGGAGQRVLVGVLLGAVYFLANRLVANSGAVYGIDPVLTAWLPTIALGIVMVVALARIR